MSGDEQGAFIIHGATDDTFQGLPGSDIQSVGRFVEQGEGSVQGLKGIRQHRFLLLSVGDGGKFLFSIDVQFFQVLFEILAAETGIEYGMAGGELDRYFQ